MKYFSLENINQLEHLYKINLINSCSGYKSANLIATKSLKKISNVAVFSSVMHLGSSPPIFGFILRPTTVPRNTYKNIIETEFYTINHIHKSILEDAHHTSAKYPNNLSEFDFTKLETQYKKNFFAPFVKNCPVQLALKFVEEIDIKINNTKLIIGKIQGIYINDNLLQNDGFVNLTKGNVASINGLDGYSIPKLEQRFNYQQPKSFN